MEENYTGLIIIASPKIEDYRFKNSVIMICEFTKNQVIGLVLNNEIKNLGKHNFLKDKKLLHLNQVLKINIFCGGPVYGQQYFVLHSNEKNYKTSLNINENFSLSTSPEILNDILSNKFPSNYRIFLGCSIWEYNQFNRELLENSWLILNKQSLIDFNNKHDKDLWEFFINELGIKKEHLSHFSGNA